MGVQYFGQFLIENGYLSRSQLLDAIDHQKSVNVKLGVLAIDQGYMSAGQVEDVILAQRSLNKRFGEIALEKGYISEQDLEKILSRQNNDRIFLGEALVEKGYLSYAQLQEYLEHFNRIQEKCLKKVDSTLAQLSDSQLLIINEGEAIFKNMILRMLDEQSIISSYIIYKDTDPEYHDFHVSQKLFGDQDLTMAISMDRELLLHMSSKLLSMDISELDELAIDGGKEFINIVIGHLCVALSNRGIKTETAPPLFISANEFNHEYKSPVIICARVLVGEKQFQLYYYLS